MTAPFPEQILQHFLHVVLPGQLHRAFFVCGHVIASFRGLPFPILIVAVFDGVSVCNVVSNLMLLRRGFEIVSQKLI